MTTARPFRILGIQQIALGAPDKNELKKLWVDMFGLSIVGNFLTNDDSAKVVWRWNYRPRKILHSRTSVRTV